VRTPTDHVLNTPCERETGNLLKYGAPGEIRTPDLQLRRLPLYPAELRARSLQFTSRVRHHQMQTSVDLPGSCCEA
jgi:hypothetical protein